MEPTIAATATTVPNSNNETNQESHRTKVEQLSFLSHAMMQRKQQQQ
jgi:hypothetical protein